MKFMTKEIHDYVLDELDRLISNAYDAKENFLHKRYEDAMRDLDEIAGANKKAEALIGEMYE